jgi:hypothetical protein
MKTHLLALAGLVVALGLPSTGSSADAIEPNHQPKPDAKLGYKDTALVAGTQWHQHDGDRPQPKVVTPAATFSDMAPPPSDAVVLFDGKDLSKWEGEKGGEAKWKVENGYVETTKTGRIHTKEQFGDFQMHLEFATPAKVEGDGQGRGNNGVNIYGRYEIQVLDSYNNPTYADGMVGAMYGQFPPLANVARPPGTWQTYDIVFRAARWDAGGKLQTKAMVTVIFNGVVIQNAQEFLGNTSYRTPGNYDHPMPPKGPIELYEHGNAVRFRNIWIRELGEYDKPKE